MLWMAGPRYGVAMRWRDLFDDLEAQMMRSEREAFEDEVRERAGGERAVVTVGAVLAASVGETIRLVLVDGSRVEGAVTDAAAQWLHVADGPREWLVPATAIATIDGVPSGAPDPGAIAARLTLGHALRALADDGGEVLVRVAGTECRGRISGVGADYLVVGSRVVRFAAVLTVSPAQ